MRHLWGHLDHFYCSLLDEVIWTSRAAYVENMNPEADDTLEKTSLDSKELGSNIDYGVLRFDHYPLLS